MNLQIFLKLKSSNFENTEIPMTSSPPSSPIPPQFSKHTLILLIIFSILVETNSQTTFKRSTPVNTLFQQIYTGLHIIEYRQGQRIYRTVIKFPNVQQYMTSLFVRDIENYEGPGPMKNQIQQLRQQSFNSLVKQWGFDFSLQQRTWKSSLLITLEIGEGVSFTKFLVGYLITRDRDFFVGHTDPIQEKCNDFCPQIREWPVSMIIRSPPTGTIFIPFIVGLKAKAPQPSISFVDVSTQPLNTTHRTLFLSMLVESLHPIEEITFSYISHSNAQAKYALLIFPGFDPNHRDDGTFYGVVEVNGYIETSLLEKQPEFFEVIGVALRKQFYLQEEPKEFLTDSDELEFMQ